VRSTPNWFWALMILAMGLGIVAQLLDARNGGWTDLGVVYVVGASGIVVVALAAITRNVIRRRRPQSSQDPADDA
jgi:hypothetical protein